MLYLKPNSSNILERQKRAAELRATGLTVLQVARELHCSPYVVQTLLNRANDRRLEIDDTGWLAGLTHSTARTVLAQGYKTKADVASALVNESLTCDQPGVGRKTLAELAQWIEAESTRSTASV